MRGKILLTTILLASSSALAEGQPMSSSTIVDLKPNAMTSSITIDGEKCQVRGELVSPAADKPTSRHELITMPTEVTPTSWGEVGYSLRINRGSYGIVDFEKAVNFLLHEPALTIGAKGVTPAPAGSAVAIDEALMAQRAKNDTSRKYRYFSVRYADADNLFATRRDGSILTFKDAIELVKQRETVLATLNQFRTHFETVTSPALKEKRALRDSGLRGPPLVSTKGEIADLEKTGQTEQSEINSADLRRIAIDQQLIGTNVNTQAARP